MVILENLSEIKIGNLGPTMSVNPPGAPSWVQMIGTVVG